MDPTKPSEDQTQATTTPTTEEPVAETPAEPEPAGGTPVAPADTPAPSPVPTPAPEPTPAAEEPEPPVGDATPLVTPPSEEEGGTDTSGPAGMGGATV